MRIRFTKPGQRGQTMVDLIVALALVSAAVTSSGLLATTSARVNTEAGRRSQATALADREIEAIRDYRTQSEKNGLAWESGASVMWPSLRTSGDNCISFEVKRTGSTWALQNVHAPGGSGTPLAYTAANAGETSGGLYDTEYSAFSRVDTVCDVSAKLGTTNTVSVKVLEEWQEANGTRQVEERTILTDWAP